jgi:hypothetical protein
VSQREPSLPNPSDAVSRAILVKPLSLRYMYRRLTATDERWGDLKTQSKGPSFSAHDHRVSAHGHKGRHLAAMDDPLDRHAGAGAGGADDGGHLVLVDELLGDVNGFGRIALGVADDQFDGP